MSAPEPAGVRHTLPLAATEARPLAAPPFTGEILQLRGNGLFLVDDLSVWFVERGTVDLFAMPVANGAPAGPRHHLLRAGPGAIFMGFDPGRGLSGRRLAAAGSDGVRLVRAWRGALGEALSSPRRTRAAQAMLEGWIEALHEAFAASGEPPEAPELATGEELSYAEPAVVRAQAGVSWVLHLEGESLLRQEEDLLVGGEGFLPLATPAWLQVQPGALIYLSRTADLTSAAALMDGVAHLGRLLWDHTERRLAELEREAAARARHVAAGSQALLEEACVRLAASALPGDGPELPSRLPADPQASRTAELLACCRLVGRALGVTINELPRSEGPSAERDPLRAILRVSRLRAREVALRDDWWRRDHGPILATAAQDGRPAALLRAGDRYLCLGAGGQARPVDASVAAALSPFGYSFYAPLPDRRLRVLDMLRFAIRGCRGEVVVAVLMSLACSALALIPAVATGILFNTIIPGAHRSQLQQMTIILGVCAVSGLAFSLVRGFALLRLEQRMGTAVQAAVWDRLLRLPLGFFRPFTAGELANRAMAIDGIHQILTGTAITAVLSGVFSLANVAMMFAYSPTMAWRGLLLIVVAIAATVLGGALELAPQREAMRLSSKTSGLVLQLLTSIGKLRVAGAEAAAFAQWATLFGQHRRLRLRIRRIGIWMATFGAGFPILAQVLIFWAALPLLAPGAAGLRTGDFLAFGGAFGSCLAALLSTSAALMGLLEVIPLYEQARPIMDARPEVQEGLSDPGILTGAIELQNVSFRYQEDAPPVLRDISLQIKAGEFVALVGPSGSGKSTLLRLLLGFEKLSSGRIYYDGQDVASLDIQAVRRQMGVVLQNGSLVAGDIFTNISAAHRCTDEEAWTAAAMAGIAEDIRAMPMQMHTVVNEGASTLSGGQRQRLMIARAIVNRPRILLFDEATSALDNRTQALVSASLDRLKATRIVVAHRLSTIVNADRIVVVDGGRVVQTGTYAQLVAEPGLFADLARRQLV
jgi:NHLM bacteriocin system ABC transporter ATP-binding protein